MGLLGYFLAYGWGRHRGRVVERRRIPASNSYCCACCDWCGTCDDDTWGCTCGAH